MKTKLLSLDIPVPSSTKPGDVIKSNVAGALTFECVEVDGELVLQLKKVDGVKVER